MSLVNLSVGLIPLFLMSLQAPPIAAAPAVRLVVDIPCEGVCPGSPLRIRVTAGRPFPLRVYALDGTGVIDTEFVGTVTFSSSDPLAQLPPSYTFTASDQGRHFFPMAGVLWSLGPQSISVSAPGLATGTWNVTVDPGGTAASVPAISDFGKVLALLLLAASGLYLINQRG